MSSEDELMCPSCKNVDRVTISALFTKNHSLCKLISRDTISDMGLKKTERFTYHRKMYFVPTFFRCEKCRQYFKLNKNGKEFVPRVSKLVCPKCHFDGFGEMLVWSRDIKPRYSKGSKDWRRTHFYDSGISFANGFECPRCEAKFG